MKAVKIIAECLVDLDRVSVCVLMSTLLVDIFIFLRSKLEEIPGEVVSEKGHKDSVTN